MGPAGRSRSFSGRRSLVKLHVLLVSLSDHVPLLIFFIQVTLNQHLARRACVEPGSPKRLCRRCFARCCNDSSVAAVPLCFVSRSVFILEFFFWSMCADAFLWTTGDRRVCREFSRSAPRTFKRHCVKVRVADGCTLVVQGDCLMTASCFFPLFLFFCNAVRRVVARLPVARQRSEC